MRHCGLAQTAASRHACAGVFPFDVDAVSVPAVHVPVVRVPAVHVPAVHVPAVHVPAVRVPATLRTNWGDDAQCVACAAPKASASRTQFGSERRGGPERRGGEGVRARAALA